MTISTWLDSVLKDGFAGGDELPLIVRVNDEIVDREKWDEFVFLPKDEVNIFIEPRGTDPFTITAALFAGVKAVFGMLMPKLPGTPGVVGQGESLSQGSVRGNKIKLGDPVREVAGRMKIYPDYLLPPRKYFQNQTEQWTELGLCIGVGDFQIFADNVKIGDTSLLSLGADADYEIFSPGETVSGYSAFNWWHQAPEVGSSSTGSAGLELTAATTITPSPNASTFQFNAYTITIPSGAGIYPEDWAAGMILRIVAPYGYTVTDGGGSARDIISGPLGMLNPSPGDDIEVVGVNAGIYTVNSYNSGTQEMTLNYSWGDPANNLTLGNGLAAIGPVGLRFRITSKTDSAITVERLDSSGDVDVSFPGFIASTLSNATMTIDSASAEGGWRGPFPAVPESEKTQLIEWDMFFPEGLAGLGREGQIYELFVSYELQWRDMAIGGAWNSFIDGHTAQTINQCGFTTQLALPYPMRPEVRVRKRSPLEENLEFRDRIEWYGLRALLNAPASYAGCTVIGVKIRTSDRIAAQTESQISVIATRILPYRSGGVWQPAIPTRDLAPFADYVRRSLGMPEDRMNYEELDRLDLVWRERQDKFDISYDSPTTAQQALSDVFGAGFAELTLDHGKITPVRDEPRTVFEQMYTPQNMVGFLRRTPKLVANPDEFDGVEVTFTDSTNWTESVVQCRLPGDQGVKVEKITAPGVTNRDKAYQIGMRRRRIQRYRPDVFSWATEGDALVSRYLSYCAVADDITGYPQSSILWSISISGATAVIESSEPLVWSIGSHSVLLRTQDGTASGPYVATRIDDYNFSITGIDFTPDVSWKKEPPHILFGETNRVCYPVLITGISPNGFSSAQVEAVGYNELVYLDDNSPAP